MRLRRYRGRHLKLRPKKRGPVVVGTATAVWAAGPAANAASYLVRPGDTLSGIAARHGVTVSAIARRNDINNPNFIIAGQRLRIRGRARTTSTHVVQLGETLSQVAARYRTTVRHLARRNHLADPNLIVAGSRLRVPARSGAPA
ncbi:MAG: LysM peptidoglycan-binding domain-containing protein, partial [Actinomycetota bacterium]